MTNEELLKLNKSPVNEMSLDTTIKFMKTAVEKMRETEV
jgi:hypothetical protein